MADSIGAQMKEQQSINEGAPGGGSGLVARLTRHLSIRGKLLLAFLSIVTMLVIIAILAIAGQQFSAAEVDAMLKRENRLALLSMDTAATFERMRQEDLAFRNDFVREGLFLAKEDHLPRFLNLAATTQQYLLDMVKLASNEEQREFTLSTLEALNSYAASFIGAVNSLDMKYDPDFGLRSVLHETLGELAKAADSAGVAHDAVHLYQHLSDAYHEHMERETGNRVPDVTKAIAAFEKGVTSHFPANLQADVRRRIQEFQRNFTELLKTTDEIAANFAEADAISAKITPHLMGVRNAAENTQAKIVAQLDQTRKLILLILLFTSLAAVVLGMWLTWGIANALTYQVDQIMVLLGNLGIGDFDARVEVVSADEMGHMAISLNAMLDNMTTMIQTQDDQDRVQESFMKLMQEIDELSEGDLTVRAEVTEDITGALADSVNTMAEKFGDIVRKVQGSSNDVDATAAEVSKLTSALAARSLEQSEQVNSAIVEVQRIADSIREVSENAARSAEVSIASRMNAREGAESVEQTQRAMDEIREQINETARAIKRLGESSMEIGNVVEIINNIADRTSILALNASIQAAMAGEAGHGFAVVAEEVQRLSESSSNSTKQIETLIKSIQAEIKDAGNRMDESISRVVQGSQLADGAYSKLQEIETVSNQLADQIESIARAGAEQVQRSEQVVLSMAAVGEISTNTANSTQETNHLMSELNETARALRATVNEFKVETAF